MHESPDEYSLYLANSIRNKRRSDRSDTAYGYDLRSGDEQIASEILTGRKVKQAPDYPAAQLVSLKHALLEVEGPARITVVTDLPLVVDSINLQEPAIDERIERIRRDIFELAEQRKIELAATRPDEDDEEARKRLDEITEAVVGARQEYRRSKGR